MRFGTRATTRRREHERSRSRGAVLVEFALVAMLLFSLLFGIIEFGHAYYEHQNVRHGAREGLRLAAVNSSPANGEPTQEENLAREVCTRMDLNGSNAQISITKSGDAIGDEVEVTVTKPLDSLTGFFPFLGSITLTSTVSTRLEQGATFADISGFSC